MENFMHILKLKLINYTIENAKTIHIRQIFLNLPEPPSVSVYFGPNIKVKGMCS